MDGAPDGVSWLPQPVVTRLYRPRHVLAERQEHDILCRRTSCCRRGQIPERGVAVTLLLHGNGTASAQGLRGNRQFPARRLDPGGAQLNVVFGYPRLFEWIEGPHDSAPEPPPLAGAIGDFAHGLDVHLHPDSPADGYPLSGIEGKAQPAGES